MLQNVALQEASTEIGEIVKPRRITARTQVGMAFIEYTLLIGFGIAGLIAVLTHHHGTVPFSRGWLSISGVGGAGSAAGGTSEIMKTIIARDLTGLRA